MSPEQWRGEQVGPAADVYSLGCVLYESLTGVVPYARRGGDAEPEMPQGLDAVIERAVAKDPADRYATAGELIEAARERQGATPAATRVLSEAPSNPPLPPGRRVARTAGRATPACREDEAVAWGRGRASRRARSRWVSCCWAATAPPSPRRSRSADPPLRLAVGPQAVWVTSAPDGTLSRIDPETGAVAGRTVRLDQGIAGVTIGAGSVWVSSPRRGEVLRVDPDSGRVTGEDRGRRPPRRDRLRRRQGLGRRRRRAAG